MATTISTPNLAELLKDVPPGAWVAISRSHQGSEPKVLAYSADMNKALDESKAMGEDQPVIIRVPETQAALLV